MTSILALTTHYFAGFLVAAELLVLLRRGSTRRRVALAALPVAAVTVLLLPLAYHQRGYSLWIGQLPFTARLDDFGRNFLLDINGSSGWREVAAAVLVVGALLLIFRADGRERSAVATVGVVGVLALTLAVVPALAHDYLLTRNMLPFWLPSAIAVAIACTVRGAERMGLVIAVGLCALSLATTVAVETHPSLQRADWRSAARLVGSASRDRLVLAWGNFRLEPFEAHLAGAERLASTAAVRVSEIDLLVFEKPSGGISCWTGAVCDVPGVRGGIPRTPKPKVALPSFSFSGLATSGLFELLRFRSSRPIRLHTRDVDAAMSVYGHPWMWLQHARPSA